MNRRVGLIIFGVALAARLLLWWASVPFVASPTTQDSHEYCTLAAALLDFNFPSLVRTPGYPLFLTLTGRPPCANLNLIFLAQSILDSVTAVLVARVAAHLTPRNRKQAALIAGILWAFSPVAATATTFVMTETLFMFLLAMALNIAVTTTTPVAAVVEGLFWTAATLTRPSGMVLPLIVCLFLFIRSRMEGRPRLISLIVYALCIGTWIGHNYQRSGEAVISTIDVTATYTFEVSAVRMLDHYGPFEYARMWILGASRAEPIREQFQNGFSEEIRSRNPALPSSLYIGWDDLSVMRLTRAEMRAELRGRLLARAYTHIVGAVQTIRPVLRWPRGGWWMTAIEIARSLLIVTAIVLLAVRREWWLLSFILVSSAYALLLPGVCGLWRFRSMAEAMWVVAVGVCCTAFRRNSVNQDSA